MNAPPASEEPPWQISLLDLFLVTAVLGGILALHRSWGTTQTLAATVPHSAVLALWLGFGRRLSDEHWSQAWGVLGGLASTPLVLLSLWAVQLVRGEGQRIGLLPCLGVAIGVWAILRAMIVSNVMRILAITLRLPPYKQATTRADRLGILWGALLSLAFPI